MRMLVGAVALAFLGLLSCRKRPAPEVTSNERDVAGALGAPSASVAAAPRDGTPASRDATSRAVLEIERDLQARRLSLAPRYEHVPRLAFSRRAIAQLTDDAVRLWALGFDTDVTRGTLLVEKRLESPRATLTLADGAVLALGGNALLRIDGKKVTSLSRPMFLPGSELFADALQPDRIWMFQGRSTTPELVSYRLIEAGRSVPLPEQRLPLDGSNGGVFGVSREGVWLYFAGERAARFAPGGARLAPLSLPSLKYPFFALPTRRLDQQYLLDGQGHLTRALVSPSFRKLAEVELGIRPLAACMADAARTLAVLALAGEGPRFELRLYDEKWALVGTAEPRSDAPTGDDDWVRTVTRNQELACSATDAQVAVGGPDRVQVFDTRGKQIFSMASR